MYVRDLAAQRVMDLMIYQGFENLLISSEPLLRSFLEQLVGIFRHELGD